MYDLCLQPWESYSSDVSIDVTKHHVPKTFGDKFAFRSVKFLRVLSDLYFKVCGLPTAT